MQQQFEWSHRRLDAWKVAMDLAIKVAEELRKFPRYELYGLSAQLRDASVSVPTNIAEGRQDHQNVSIIASSVFQEVH